MRLISADDTGSAHTFGSFVNNMNKMRCRGEDCVKGIKGFMENTPWIGHPSSFEISPRLKEIKVKCFSKSENLTQSVVLVKKFDQPTNSFFDDDEDDSLEIQTFDKTSTFESKVLVTTFTIRKPEKYLGKLYCQSSDRDHQALSRFPLELKEATRVTLWSQWTSWSKCEDKARVGIDKVTRSRQGQTIETQERYCRCSDLKELPRPRYIFRLRSKRTISHSI